MALLAHSLLALLLSVLLARALGPGGRGLYGTATLLAAMVAALGTLGFDTGNTLAVGRRSGSAPAVLGASLALAGGCGIGLVLLTNLAVRLGALGHVDTGYVAVATIAIPFLILSALLQGLLSGLGFAVRASWLNALGVGITLVLSGAAFMLASSSVPAVLVAFVVASASSATIMLGTTFVAAGRRIADPEPALREHWRVSLTSHGANVLHLLHLRIDVFLVTLFVSPVEVGLYILSQGVCEWIWLLPRAAAVTLLPTVAAADEATALQRTAQMSRITLVLAGLGAFVLAAGSGLLVPALFGRAFAGSVTPLRLLLPGVWIASVAGVLSAQLTGRGHPVYPLINSLVSLLANVGLNLLLVPRYGIAGAAASSSITYALSTGINLWFVHRVSGMPLWELLPLKRAEYVTVFRMMSTSIGRNPPAAPIA